MSDKINFLQKISDKLDHLSSQNGDIVVQDGQRIGPGIGADQNTIVGNTVSKNSYEARQQDLYEQSVLQQLYEDPAEDEMEGIVDRYIDKIVDDMFKGV